MHHYRLIKAWWLVIVFAMCSTSSVSAFPPLPSSFYGTVQQEGNNIPDGTLVEALIEGKVMAYSHSETYQGTSVFSLDVPGDESATDIVEGGMPGQRIEFRVGGMLADQSAQWTSGVNENIDLTLSAGQVLSPTIPTFTPVPSQTQIPIGTHTPAVTQTPANSSGDIEPTINISITNTQVPSSTQTEINGSLQVQSDDGTNGIDAKGNPLNTSISRTDEAALLISLDEEDQDALVVIGDTDLGGSVKNNSALWVGVSFLVLICVAASVLAVRIKHGNEMNSPLF